MFPGWMRWLFLGVMGYLLYIGSVTPKQIAPSAATSLPPITEENYPALAKTLDASHWKRRLNPNYEPDLCGGTLTYPPDTLPMKWVEEAAGSGAEAACGDAVRATITVWNNAGRKQAEEIVRFTLGTRPLAAGIDQLLVGSRPGMVRTAWLPPAALIRTKGEAVPAALLAALPPGKTAILTVERLAD